MAVRTAATATSMRPPVMTDARPIIPRNDTNLWTRAERLRDELYEQLEEACHSEGIKPLLLSSGPAVFPAWVKFEAWQPQSDRGTTARSSALITIEPKPFHSHEFEFEVTYTRRDKSRTLKRVVPLSGAEVRELIEHLVHDGPKPDLRRFREVGFQFWREKNKIELLGIDWLTLAISALVVAGLGLVPVPLLAILLWTLAVVVFFVVRKRKLIVRNEGKPDREPRTLIRVDSWQTVLFNLGDETEEIRKRFTHALQDGLGAHCKFRMEHVWYWGLDGKEEREQFVLTSGRVIVFCQLYRYGKDLYFGWDGHLNLGQWVEEMVAAGIDRQSGNPISINRVVPGTQVASDFDLTDLSALMEWTHAQIVKLLKQLIAEKKIDQEIDFKIQRAERQQVASGAAAASGRKDGKTGRALFQRTG